MTTLNVPNFFIVGAPKAGTTSLYSYLGQHPQVYLSPLKEPHYFASEFRPENLHESARLRISREARALEAYLRGDLRERRFGGMVSSWDDYIRLFGNVTNEIAIGEATPEYLWSPSAARNIVQSIPQAKIIISLRNPVDRAFSQFLQMVAVGTARESFIELISASLRCSSRQIGAGPWPLLEFGRYYEQVGRYLREFPEAQIHVSLYEDLQAKPLELLSDLFGFLGVERSFVPDVSHRSHQPRIPRLPGLVHLLKKWGMWSLVRNLGPRTLGPGLRSLLVKPRAHFSMRPQEREFLADYYREDIEKLSSLIKRDLTGWLSTEHRT